MGCVHTPCIDIPPEADTVETYSVTLGHKSNHNFKNNAVFRRFNLHPVLGQIMSVVAVKDIPKGAEVFSNYNYSERDYKIAGIKFTEVQCENVSSLQMKIKIKLISFKEVSKRKL